MLCGLLDMGKLVDEVGNRLHVVGERLGCLVHFPPKFAHFFVPVITFFPFLLCK